MKIAQFYKGTQIRLGLVERESLVPIDFDGDMVAFIEQGGKPMGTGNPVPLTEVILAPPVSRPFKIIALGLNYKDHADEFKGSIPEVPLVFAKFPNSLIGHNQEIAWRRDVTKKVDFEAELAVIIGKTIRDCTEDVAFDAVFGYTCANDVSARDLQFGDGQWVRGKSLDTFCPLGPWLVTADEVHDPHDLSITCRLNGKIMQNSHTGLMIFRIPSLISFLSSHFTLTPGDIILTGTPQGAGAFRDPPLYLKDGDEVIVEIERVGRLVNTCRVK
jgi:2-keto-4-pentenoate hydratase/2-oxohepta-3-ene-1,7-dioic acid hydratase in catechol pathway